MRKTALTVRRTSGLESAIDTFLFSWTKFAVLRQAQSSTRSLERALTRATPGRGQHPLAPHCTAAVGTGGVTLVSPSTGFTPGLDRREAGIGPCQRQVMACAGHATQLDIRVTVR